MGALEAWPDIAAWRAAQGGDQGGDPVDGGEIAAGPLAGACNVCERQVRFPASAPGQSLREGLPCPACGSNARQRAAVAVLQTSGARPARVYMTEQAGPFYRVLRMRWPGVVGSEYATRRLQRWRVAAWLWRHALFERVRVVDVTALPFGDGSFDAVLSLDVLEHVHDHAAALRGFARILRPGGRCVLTVPFDAGAAASRQRARLDASGAVEHLLPPQYHGDPLGGGVLCFHDFGWDLLDAMRAAGFSRASAVRVRDPARGVPEAVWVLLGER